MICDENIVDNTPLVFNLTTTKQIIKYTPQVPDEYYKETQCIRKGQLRRLGTKSILRSIVLKVQIAYKTPMNV